MNPLQRALIEKVGVDNGFEHTLAADKHAVTVASARQPARATIALADRGFEVSFSEGSPALVPELRRSFPQAAREQALFHVDDEAALAMLLRRAAGLSRSLPNQAAVSYAQAWGEELARMPPGLRGTEVERLVRQRVGQQAFREAMLDYWGGACAVTGVAIPEVLRASHAKPWSECASDAERLDVFNGFLLVANLDALFDRFLISFDRQGALLISASLSHVDLPRLGIVPGSRLRWLSPAHHGYLDFHRGRLLNPE